MIDSYQWRIGESREYDPIVNAGCCWCLGKDWPCRFPARLVRIGNCACPLSIYGERSEIEEEETESETCEKKAGKEISKT